MLLARVPPGVRPVPPQAGSIRMAPCGILTAGAPWSRSSKTYIRRRGLSVAKTETTTVETVSSEDQELSVDNMPDDTPLHLLLPAGFELRMDELASKYTHMDERLDALERALLEMTRELKSGTASLTGGVTTISTGGYAGAGVSTGIVPPHSEQGDKADGDQHAPAAAKDGKKREGTKAAADKRSRDGEEDRVVEVEPAGPPRPSGIPVREVIASGGIGHSDGAESRFEVMEEGLKAAERARMAREVVDDMEQQQQQQQQAGQHADGNPLQNLADGARRAVVSALGGQEGQHSQQHPHPPPHAHQNGAPPAAPAQEPKESHNERHGDSPAKQLAVQREEALLLQRAAASAGVAIAGQQATAGAAGSAAAKSDGGSAGATGLLRLGGSNGNDKKKKGSVATKSMDGKEQAVVSAGKDAANKALLGRKSLYDFNRLQSAITELANSGYIESVKQLRETLIIQEWDLSNRHLAKRRGVTSFERYIAERDLVHEVGGYAVLTALYEDPDSLEELLPDERMRMLARSMIEECLNERRLALWNTCNQTAKELATMTSSGLVGRLLQPVRAGAFGFLARAWGAFKLWTMPWLGFLRVFRVF